ncbi:MAG: hypothetical protein FJ095_01260 [Deltaproteobacteria bacterium]|nr:hypothetical protein [Deltaproteobacteria bacterium]
METFVCEAQLDDDALERELMRVLVGRRRRLLDQHLRAHASLGVRVMRS